jgi:hypothetical protein
MKPALRTTSELREQPMEASKPPLEIESSLDRFRNDHSDASRAAFIMMKFGNTDARRKIVNVIKDVLWDAGIKGLRADDKTYHEDLFSNVLTYIYGCGIGIAVFERTEAEEFNPNVSLEVGYMLALGKPVCFLKDDSLRALPTDLAGKLYINLSLLAPRISITQSLDRWLADKGLKVDLGSDLWRGPRPQK